MSPVELSAQIGIPLYYLKRLAKRSERCYVSFYKEKKSGKNRPIDAPNQELKGIQSWILRNILNEAFVSPVAHGFVKNKGIKSNANLHCKKRYILCMDIEEFFPNISFSQVFEVFKSIVKNRETAQILTKLCCLFNRLPQGAVTSPLLSNAVFAPVDDKLTRLAESKRISYSRYADDLTFSSNNRHRISTIIADCTKILEDNGYKPNTNKTRVMSGRHRKIVTGLILNRGTPSIGRQRKRNLRAAIYNLISKNDKTVDQYWVVGMLAFLRDIEPAVHTNYIEYINKLKNIIRSKNNQ